MDVVKKIESSGRCVCSFNLVLKKIEMFFFFGFGFEKRFDKCLLIWLNFSFFKKNIVVRASRPSRLSLSTLAKLPWKNRLHSLIKIKERNLFFQKKVGQIELNLIDEKINFYLFLFTFFQHTFHFIICSINHLYDILKFKKKCKILKFWISNENKI